MSVAEPVSRNRGEKFASAALSALPIAVLVIDSDLRIVQANPAAEQLFDAGASFLMRRRLTDLIHDDNPFVGLVRQVFSQGRTVSEYAIDLHSSRMATRKVDAHVAAVSEDKSLVVASLRERSMALKIDHQLTHRRAARSVAGMASVLAHEIRTPLQGIRGAAQLLEMSASDQDQELTQLICAETDRIRNLVDRMEVFSDGSPLERDPVNVHDVLGQVRKVAVSSFARRVKFTENYDPSLPLVFGNRDQLVQVFMNLVKNASEAVADEGGEITLSTSFRHGLRIAVPGTSARVELPILVSVEDNGPGIPEDLRGLLFEPFVTTKTKGSGLGLSLVAKIVEDHGGVVEVDSRSRRTKFSVMLPMHHS